MMPYLCHTICMMLRQMRLETTQLDMGSMLCQLLHGNAPEDTPIERFGRVRLEQSYQDRDLCKMMHWFDPGRSLWGTRRMRSCLKSVETFQEHNLGTQLRAEKEQHGLARISHTRC